ncbi:hypothetical protein [Sulfurihydrogenibium yellowstonense]|uniref:Uncharacterized protein n=1 Tax=Sulfurihydrogenibium yellowstonense SS-5 TaxID=432331 RepID=C4FM01_9AQUI|nr:hypothetical protein [Sulfurihydrogenibium yellowstonense]EEP59897.1 hypothetical protein SULYE_1605 [Sulfurihydrogenibium yellowstonense SS-5]
MDYFEQLKRFINFKKDILQLYSIRMIRKDRLTEVLKNTYEGKGILPAFRGK